MKSRRWSRPGGSYRLKYEAMNPPVASDLAGITITIDGPPPQATHGLEPLVEYAGGAPGVVCGVAQINLVVPSGTASGSFPVAPWWQLTVNGVATPALPLGATIVVK